MNAVWLLKLFEEFGCTDRLRLGLRTDLLKTVITLVASLIEAGNHKNERSLMSYARGENQPCMEMHALSALNSNVVQKVILSS